MGARIAELKAQAEDRLAFWKKRADREAQLGRPDDRQYAAMNVRHYEELIEAIDKADKEAKGAEAKTTTQAA